MNSTEDIKYMKDNGPFFEGINNITEEREVGCCEDFWDVLIDSAKERINTILALGIGVPLAIFSEIINNCR